jgi:hypothetical protein
MQRTADPPASAQPKFQGEYMGKKVLVAALFLLAMLSSHAFAQKNEVSFIVGGTFSPDTTATVGVLGVTCPTTSPNCASIPVSARVDTNIGFEGAYARRILDAHAAALYLELPVLGVPARDVHLPPINLQTLFPPPASPSTISAPADFSSVFFTPSLRVKLLPNADCAVCQRGGRGCAFQRKLHRIRSRFTSDR